MRKTAISLFLLGTLLAAGCEDKPKMVDAEQAEDAGHKAVDPALAKAVAEAKASDKAGAASTHAPGEPPESGVFGPGEADKAMPKGAPPKIVLGGDGAAPRVKLDLAPAPGFKRTAETTFSLRTGSGGLPPLALSLSIEAKKPKAGGAAGAAPVDMTVTIVGAKVDQPSTDIPKDFLAQITKLKGSRIEYEITPDGAGRNFNVALSKAADPGLQNALGSMAEAMATLAVPFPDKPIGNGAYWMVTNRESLAGLDVVAYRLVKVESIAGDTLTLSVSTKRYAASDKIATPGLPPDLKDATLAQFSADSTGTIQVEKDTPFPVSASVTQTLIAPLTSPKSQGQPVAGLRAQTKVDFKLGGGKKK